MNPVILIIALIVGVTFGVGAALRLSANTLDKSNNYGDERAALKDFSYEGMVYIKKEDSVSSKLMPDTLPADVVARYRAGEYKIDDKALSKKAAKLAKKVQQTYVITQMPVQPQQPVAPVQPVAPIVTAPAPQQPQVQYAQPYAQPYVQPQQHVQYAQPQMQYAQPQPYMQPQQYAQPQQSVPPQYQQYAGQYMQPQQPAAPQNNPGVYQNYPGGQA